MIPPCPRPDTPCEARAEAFRQKMELLDALHALVLPIQRFEWPRDEVVKRALDLLTYPHP